jgi:hypothetical protein
MRLTIILLPLNTRSSYKEDRELPADDPNAVQDTVQWCIYVNHAFRIRTYSIDHDVHVHKIGPTTENLVAIATSSNSKGYGDVIRSQHVFEFDSIPSADEASRHLTEEGLPGLFEYLSDDCLFWNPDSEPYLTQSRPE